MLPLVDFPGKRCRVVFFVVVHLFVCLFVLPPLIAEIVLGTLCLSGTLSDTRLYTFHFPDLLKSGNYRILKH